MEHYRQILKQYWGFDDFRALQGDIITSISNGRDTLGLMPTGGGKSITFQVPAMLMPGVCIVVTPLIALMKDQVENLRRRKIKATAVYSGMRKEEIIVALENCIFGDYKFLYVSPERLSTELFLSRLREMTVSLIAVDESHCISQWGYDFRPSYLHIADMREHLPDVPVLALTATATSEVVKDIQHQLKFRRENVFKKSFERKNLSYIVRHTEDKSQQLLKILAGVPGTAIVYVRDRKKTKEIADFLNQNGITAAHFHAGLTNEIKDRCQTDWKSDKIRVMVATNAFGMGIDKPDVRVVVHLDLPDSLEAYFQEAGRGGRDEMRAYAVLLYNRSDSTKMKKRLSDSFPDKERIIKTYNKLGNYFELAVGSGKEMVFPFNLNDFCLKFKLPILPTYNALKMLEQAEYICLTDESDNPSRIMFIVKRDELYSVQINNPELDRLMQLLLRSYTGLFTEYAHINEDLLAKRLDSNRQTVYEQLKTLGKLGVVSYIPAKKTPFVVYTCNRLDEDKIHLSKAVYDDRRERYKTRTEAMLHYATAETGCRSQILLRYFGQTGTRPCGQCDLCLKNKAQNMQQTEYEKISREIEILLKEEPRTMTETVAAIKNRSDEKTIRAIRFLIDEGKIGLKNSKMLWLQ